MSIKTVLLAGSGGFLAPTVLKALLASSFKISILSRKSSKSPVPEGVNVIRVGDDYPYDELVAAFKGQDAVVSMVIAGQKTMIDAAVAAGVKRFIPSDFGSDNTSPIAQRAVPPFAEKVQVREYLEEKAKEGSLTWTAIGNGPFFDWTFDITKGGFFKIDLANKKALVFDDGNQPWSSSTLAQVGKAVVKTLEHPEETKNKFILIESFAVTQNGILEGLEKVLGFKFEREVVGGKAWFEEKADKAAAGDVPAIYDAIIGWSVLDGAFKDKKDYFNGILGLEDEDFDETIKALAKRL